MFKKLLVGVLATGIALTGGISAASASTESASVDNTNNYAPIKALNEEFYDYIYKFPYEYVTERGIYRTYKFYSESGKFANYFESDGIKWYFKGVALEFVNGGAYGHYEGVRSN
ncbi:hypothetical protein ICS_05674 [Bacillus cereus BAG2O-3]|uniref:LCI fold domain-containing protein n=1 Tax=Bacillus wiedmannii TaxID=1890302 RepID=A0A2B6SDV2_9BACI|nr:MULTISPECIES: LCI fold-containing protein [Bacillus]EOP02040.1 hypothetical protein ICS_05674 [Bacillus cereus BAG2O-3]EOQ22238.1 hypothetical protein KQ1_05815 [Bacillus cereus BAG3O-1]PFW85751.1 hypothetical protein COL27_06550 [Bacillus sp. AFS075960]PGT82967.1 hypothetical protein COD18_29430 [Bacillus cereus]PGC17910.1 hypothetical protein COM08_15540 [Bacillus wiedmannii]